MCGNIRCLEDGEDRVMIEPLQEIDMLFSEGLVQRAVDRVARAISDDLAAGSIIPVAVMEGGAWFSRALCERPELRHRISAPLQVRAHRTVRDGVMGPVRIEPDFGRRVLPLLSGAAVLLIDDILDEGKTLSALTRLIAPVADTLHTAVLVRRVRLDGGYVRPVYAGIETDEPGWLVGCGMDSDGRYRDLPFIGVKRGVAGERRGG